MAFPFAATIAAQRGPQTEFLRTAADVCIYGGAAGGGKTVGLILEPLRYVSRVPGFTAVFFRRTTPQVTNPGGLWDESLNFYPRFGERTNGTGRGAVRSSFPICSSTPRSTTGRAPRSRCSASTS